MNIQLLIHNKLIKYERSPDQWLPLLTVVLSFPHIAWGQAETDEFNDDLRELGISFPVHLLLYKSGVSWSFSTAFGISLTIAYQWSY